MNLYSGILVKAIAGFYYVETGNDVFECKARGVFRKEGISPVVGDLCDFSVDKNNKGFIENIHPRKNILQRPPLSNIDRVYIVSSTISPAFNPLIADRFIAIAEDAEIEPVVVITKTDLADGEQYAEIYRLIGLKTFCVCCKTGEGIEELKASIGEGINVFTGNTGVGKSSVLNLLFPNLQLKTGEISEKLGRGRHTTRHVELFKSGNCYVADTPGFSSLENEKWAFIRKENLQFAFREFLPFLGKCKFPSCSHISEKGCEICKAVEDGIIHPQRHGSYIALYKEAEKIKDWEKP